MGSPRAIDIGELPVGLVVVDTEDVIVEANSAFERWASIAPATGQRFGDLVEPAEDFLDGAATREAHFVVRIGDPDRAALIIRTPRDDGSLITLMDGSDRYRTGHELRRSLSLAGRTRTRLELVIEASIAFAEATSESRLAEVLAETTAKAYAAEESVVLLVDDSGHLEPVAGSNPFEGMFDTRAMSGAALTLRRVLKVSGAAEGDALAPALGRAMRETGVQALIAAPLHHEDDVFGLFVCFFRHPREFDDEAAPLADALAGQAAQTLTGLRLQRRLQHAALHDETTGLPNRRLLEQRSQATESPAAVVFVDLDGFKAVNDQLGHERGDELLAEVGRRLLATVRDSDVVARYGGDEFVVICHSADEGIALDVAERIRATIGEPYEFLPGSIPLAASVGVAVADPDDPFELAPMDALIRAADLAMYRAKAEGGDRVVVGRSRLY
ncbi:MAG TPA: sensor domain-containing diguanylate cyclase [Pseudolysinimonas sp.]|nr:sensor domain-containing diguanylate cyclase [Pseudolysinimonas sp.]